MPTIQIGMCAGRTVDQKRDLVQRVTQAVGDALGVGPDAVRIADHRERTSQRCSRGSAEERLVRNDSTNQTDRLTPGIATS